jgi:hypothetical protein
MGFNGIMLPEVAWESQGSIADSEAVPDLVGDCKHGFMAKGKR